MARVYNNELLKGVSGKLGELVIKQYKYGIVISKKPSFNKRRKKTELQKLKQDNFKKAVKYAQSILKDVKKKKAYAKKLKKGASVYHAAIKEYLKKNK
jgi:hypothetical protein